MAAKFTVHGRMVIVRPGDYYIAVAGGGLALATYGAGYPEARESLRARQALMRACGLQTREVAGETRREMPCLARESAQALMRACGARRRSASPSRRGSRGR